MKPEPGRRSSLFIIELMIAILFFSLAAAVCVQLFTKARILSNNTTVLNHAVLQCESMAEAVEACGMDTARLQQLFGESSTDTAADASSVSVYYDAAWQFSAVSDAAYVMTAALSQDNGFILADIKITAADSSETIYTLNTKTYFPVSVK